MKSILFSLFCLTASTNLLALDAGGCACCRAPGTFAPPHGGIVERSQNHGYVEVVANRSQVQLYFLDSDLESVPIDNIEVTGKIRLPRQSKSPQTLSFDRQHGRFVAKVNVAPTVHRYVLELVVTRTDEQEKMRFQIEPDV